MRDNTRQNVAHLMQRVINTLRGMLGEQTLSPEEYTGPEPTDVLSSEDVGTRLMILACLSAVGEADLTFVTHISREASEEERLRSLAWLKEQDCIVERHHSERRGLFWHQRVELIFYAATPTGRLLWEKIEALVPENASKTSISAQVYNKIYEFLTLVIIAGGIVLMFLGLLSHLH